MPLILTAADIAWKLIRRIHFLASIGKGVAGRNGREKPIRGSSRTFFATGTLYTDAGSYVKTLLHGFLGRFNKHIRLVICFLDTLTRDVEIFGFQFYADEFAA